MKGAFLWCSILWYGIAFAFFGFFACMEWDWIDHAVGIQAWLWCLNHWKTAIVLCVAYSSLGSWIEKERRKLVNPPRVPGICHQCGYDLRGTPNRCPECGTAAKF